MTRLRIIQPVRRIAKKLCEIGLFSPFRIVSNRLLGSQMDMVPLAHVDRTTLFAMDTDEVRAREKKQMRATSMLYDASHVESTYPLVFEWNGCLMRYAFLPATEQSKGLVILFHGHNAYLHLGPMAPWQHFDILAPWDTFGWHRQGSWFWGERGNNFVELMVFDVIRKHRESAPDQPWFCMGGSMGGFGALYHGIKYHCDGVYVMAPQVDLHSKIVEYGRNNHNNPYGYLQGETLDTVPDLLSLAETQETLPPLFLVQHQYDPVNCFADHAFRLLDIYNRKNAWYGARVYPAIGHGGDGRQQEAELFFSLIVDKIPPKRVEFRRTSTSRYVND